MDTPNPPFDHDVIVAGAGPVGLLLACELILARCRVLVLEKSPVADGPLKRAPFGIRGLNAPSIDAMRRHGLLDALRLPSAAGFAHVAPGQGGHFAGIPFRSDGLDPSPRPAHPAGAPPAPFATDMATLETALAHRAQRLGVSIVRGAAVTGVRQTPSHVLVEAGASFHRAAWLVGCDGARSMVRKSGGFEFAGTEPEFTGYSAHVALAEPHPLQRGRNLTPAGMYLQMQPGFIIVQDFDGGAFHDAGRPPTPAHLQAVLRRVSGTGVTLEALHAASTWTDRARQATRYRDGRILLAGDAAHIHAPLGGQGLNLGIGDALDLGGKLAAVLHGAAPDVLDAYEHERHAVGAEVLAWSRAQVALMRPDPGTRALRAIVQDLLQTRDGAAYMAARLRDGVRPPPA